MQNLTDISRNSLILQLPTFDDKALMRLYEQISQWLRNHGDKIGKSISVQKHYDIERKRSIVLKELHARGYNLKSKEMKEWMKKINTKLKRTYDV